MTVTINIANFIIFIDITHSGMIQQFIIILIHLQYFISYKRQQNRFFAIL